MKTRNALLLGCFTVILITVTAFIVANSMITGSRHKSIGNDTWLVIDPSGEVPDYSEVRASGLWDMGNISVDDICQRIKRAANDGKIKGILLRPQAAVINYANLDEINAALQEFKKSKKPVIAHGEMLAQRDYILCSMADKVYLDPSATSGVVLEGVTANILFYKRTLDKLGVKMHVMQAGEFKGAGEPYTNTALSPGTEQNLRRVLKCRYDLMQADIAGNRRLDTLKVRDAYEQRPDLIISAAQAKQYGLIDDTRTWEDLKTEYKISKERSVAIGDYSTPSIDPDTGRLVAVIYLSGNITPAAGFSPEGVISADKVERALRAIRDNSNVKAVVLRVNSPGGSAAESEKIYQKLKKLDLPIVISMGGVAASGGYYISCAGDYIFADAHTITGSIGVIMTLPEAEELGNKLGIDSQTLSYGKFANNGSIFEKYDQELLNSLSRNCESVYTEFKQRVMDARKISPDVIKSVAEGRVFSAADAKAINLIDEVGGLDTAVKKAASLAGIERYKVRAYPRKIGIMELFRDAGFFQMASNLVKERDMDPEQRLEKYLERTLQTRQWLYFSPYKLD
jgi:protease IV